MYNFERFECKKVRLSGTWMLKIFKNKKLRISKIIDNRTKCQVIKTKLRLSNHEAYFDDRTFGSAVVRISIKSLFGPISNTGCPFIEELLYLVQYEVHDCDITC